MKKLPLLCLMLILLPACVYRMNIPQGVIVTQKQLNQVKTGMSRQEVESILGSPLLTNVFHTNRVDYYRSLIPGSESNKPPFQKDTVIYYNKDNQVSNIKSKNLLPMKNKKYLKQS